MDRRVVPILALAVGGLLVPSGAAAVPVTGPSSAGLAPSLAVADAPAAAAPVAVPEEPTSVTVDLGDGARPTGAVPGGPATLGPSTRVVDSGERTTEPFTVLGVSWARSNAPVEVRYRTHSPAGWSAWRTAREGEGEAGRARVNTDALVVDDADGFHVVVVAQGALADVSVVLIDPGADPVGAADARMSSAQVFAEGSVARPQIITRAGWGADESRRPCAPEHTTEIVSAAVHHTVSSNSYSPDEAAGIVRGIYAYHTLPEASGGRGWCDIGYNALVDRFGRIYEGRGGSFDRSVVGVHTGGFNSRTFGVSVIGNFVSTVPSAEVIEGVSQAIAWKFATERILGDGAVTMVSGGGASKYAAGTVVTFPTIYGHRDAQLTACPGEQLYARLGQVRARVSQLVNGTVHASPVANWEATTVTQSSVSVTGWAFDPDDDSALTVDVVVDDGSHAVTASGARPDVAAAYGVGSAHGFSATIPTAAGRHVVCLWVRNVGPGNDQLLGCRDVEVRNATPIGFVDQVATTAGSVRLTGWALDTDTSSPIGVHVYVDGSYAGATTADGDRPDIAAAFPSAGSRHGFTVEVPAPSGRHTVCAYAINAPAGHNPAIGCRDVTLVNTVPRGFLDAVTTTPSSVRLVGWTFDPDTAGPIGVHVYVNGAFAGATTADVARPDVGAAFPAAGPAHGFDVDVPTGAGSLRVCAFAINAPAGFNPTIGCRVVTVVNAAPVGFLDQMVATPTGVRVAGWVFDPDAPTAALALHAYVDGVFAGALTADGARPDVGAAYPAAGPAHGFGGELGPVAPGRHRVCLYVINTPVGFNPPLACRDLVVG